MGSAAASGGVAPSDRVVMDAIRAFEREADRIKAGPLEINFMWTGEAISRRAALREAALSAGRPDRMLLIQVPAFGASVTAILPFSGDDALPAEFSAYLEEGTPGIASLVRSANASPPSWRVNLSSSGPAGYSLTHALESRSALQAHIAWDHYFDSARVLALEWALQVVPFSTRFTRVLMRTGRLGARCEDHGLTAFISKLPEVFQALSELRASGHSPVGQRALPMFPSLAAAL